MAKSNGHMRFLGDATFCPEKRGRCKIIDANRCSYCGAEVKPWRKR